MEGTTFNWALFQVVIDCLLILLILYLLYVLFKEQKQRNLLKKWVLRQLRLREDSLPTDNENIMDVMSLHSVEEAVKRLQREISNAQRLLEAMGVAQGPEEPEKKEKARETEELSPPASGSQRLGPAPSEEARDPVKEAIRYLLKKGMSPLEISKQLHIPIEDVERAYGADISIRKKILD